MTARFAPIWNLACRKARECTKLTAELRELRLDNAILRAHLKLAISQRERARDIAAAMSDHPTAGWTEDDDAWVRSLGERGSL
jgi:hypothetical protein